MKYEQLFFGKVCFGTICWKIHEQAKSEVFFWIFGMYASHNVRNKLFGSVCENCCLKKGQDSSARKLTFRGCVRAALLAGEDLLRLGVVSFRRRCSGDSISFRKRPLCSCPERDAEAALFNILRTRHSMSNAFTGMVNTRTFILAWLLLIWWSVLQPAGWYFTDGFEIDIFVASRNKWSLS